MPIPFDTKSAISKYIWRIDGIVIENIPGSEADTLEDYTHFSSLGVGFHNIDLKVVSKKGCESAFKLKNIEFRFLGLLVVHNR